MKDLKTEYQKLTEDNVPDLWDRIEAEIDKIEEQQAEENDSSKIININKTEKKKINTLKYMPITAAAAMLLFSLGIYMMMRNGGKNMTSAPTADYAASDSSVAYEEACDSEMAYEEAVREIATNEEAKAVESDFATENGSANDSIRELSGKVIIEENENYAWVTTEDGEEVEVFIPSELLDNVKQIADSNVDIVLERADKSLISTFPEEYKEVCWKIKEIELLFLQ